MCVVVYIAKLCVGERIIVVWGLGRGRGSSAGLMSPSGGLGLDIDIV